MYDVHVRLSGPCGVKKFGQDAAPPVRNSVSKVNTVTGEGAILEDIRLPAPAEQSDTDLHSDDHIGTANNIYPASHSITPSRIRHIVCRSTKQGNPRKATSKPAS
jgi:hypothetical protein